MRREYRVIIVGGGHAGVEAAWAAANMLGETSGVALVTLKAAKIGVMSCNPAIGGLAKGQLVREVDALGGLMGLVADATGLNFKELNTSRGPAVRGPRCQSDKEAYAEVMRACIASRPEIDVIEAAVDDLLIEDGRCVGVRVLPASSREALPVSNPCDAASVAAGREDHVETPRLSEPASLRAGAVVMTTGTFMRGLMHTGEQRTPGGRHGEAPAVGISAALERLGFELGRLKTGTPPRLNRDTIAWDALEPQWGDQPPKPFSELTLAGESGTGLDAADTLASAFPVLPQVECRQTHTIAIAHDFIRANLHRAPMFSGQITSVGPRYCPSIEDKVSRFKDRDSHGVFLEPESLRTNIVYCNGIASSLPIDVQERIVRTMPGCERAEVIRYGYAVEYDTVRAHQIHATGMAKRYPGLFFAGQINGTSGYEEAAAQGLIAGVNAVLHTEDRPEFVLGRDEAYIGVLMDDLVTRTPTEPYRMFTSRAEHRLLLRPDNADQRLTARARELGLLSGELGRARWRVFERRSDQRRSLANAAGQTRLDGQEVESLARRPDFDLGRFRDALPGVEADPSVWESVFAEIRYAPYIARGKAEAKRRAELERRRLPSELDYASMIGLRTEAKQALSRFRPTTFGQAGRLEGITPADLTLLSVLVSRAQREAAS